VIQTSLPQGTRFWRWVTTSPVYSSRTPSGNQKTVVDVLCDCGTQRTVIVWNLRKGLTKGCKSCQPWVPNEGNFPQGTTHPRYKGPGNTKRDIKTDWLLEEKSQPCMDCHRRFPHYCMEFDHVPERGKKLFMVNLSTCQGRWTLEEMKNERQKCDLVCSVCHNHRTWERDNNLPHVPLTELTLCGTDSL
jgi:hypothetical protein